MKKQAKKQGLESLTGLVVTLFCANYIYTGKLVSTCGESALLENPKIVYETGSFNEASWKDAQALPHELNVMRNSIESFGIVK